MYLWVYVSVVFLRFIYTRAIFLISQSLQTDFTDYTDLFIKCSSYKWSCILDKRAKQA